MGRLALGVLVVLAAGAGCADIVGAHFDDPKLAPGAAPCDVGSAGQVALRFGDLVPSADHYDFCLARADGSSPFGGSPALASGSDAQTGGVGYEQIAAPIAVPADAYQVELQPAGQGCSGAPLATASVCVSAESTTILAIGDGVASTAVGAFPETTTTSAAAATLRFVDAIENGSTIDFGTAGQASLPVALTPFFTNVWFGAAGAAVGPSPGPSDADGYVVVPQGQGASTVLAAGPSGGSEAATLVTSAVLSAGHRYTVFAAGSASDLRFPDELYVCDETQSDGGLTSCGGPAASFTIDTLNANLIGSFGFAQTVREQPFLDVFKTLDSDAACVSYVMPDADKKQLVLNAITSGRFLYSQSFVDTLDTSVDDPTDAQGATPPPPSAPPCADAAAQAQLASALACVSASCSARPNDPTAAVEDDSEYCIATKCSGPVSTLIGQAPACWVCALDELEGYTSFQDTTTACTTDPKAGLLWNGASGVVLLSQAPLSGGWQYVLPGTLARTTMVGATVALSTGTPLDLVCVQAPILGDGVVVPYTGAYGDGQTGSAGWQQELLLDTRKMVQRIQAGVASPGHRTIAAGFWGAGPSVPGVLQPFQPQSFAVLTGAFPMGAPIGYAPACTFCASNPILQTVPNVVDQWGNYPVLGRIPVTDVTSASVTLTEATVPSPSGVSIPVSPVYGFRSVIRIRP